MTSIRDRIAARPDLAQALAAKDLTALADGLNAQPELAHQSRFITARGIMTAWKGGNEFLDKLDDLAPVNSAVRRAVSFLNGSTGLDIGDPYTLGMIDLRALDTANTKITDDDAKQLKALSLAPVYVTRLEVEAELFNPSDSGS